MSDHLPQHWVAKLCCLLSVPGWDDGTIDPEVRRLLTAWAQAEGGTADSNPLNSTNHVSSQARGQWQGVDYNLVHVANYDSPIQGVMATADTLLQSAFAGIVADLRASTHTAEEIVHRNAAEFALWGTGSTLLLKVLAG